MKTGTTRQASTASEPRPKDNRERGTLTVKEVSRCLGIGRNQVYTAARNGELPGVLRIGGRILISRIAFERMLSGEPLAPIAGDLR